MSLSILPLPLVLHISRYSPELLLTSKEFNDYLSKHIKTCPIHSLEKPILKDYQSTKTTKCPICGWTKRYSEKEYKVLKFIFFNDIRKRYKIS